MHRISQVLLGFGVRVDQGRTSQPRGPFRLLWGQEMWAQRGLTEAQAAGSRDLDTGTGGSAAGSGDLDAGTRGLVLSWEPSARSALSSGSSARTALSGGRQNGRTCPQKLKRLVVWHQLLLQLRRHCHCGAQVWRQRLGAQE